MRKENLSIDAVKLIGQIIDGKPRLVQTTLKTLEVIYDLYHARIIRYKHEVISGESITIIWLHERVARHWVKKNE